MSPAKKATKKTPKPPTKKASKKGGAKKGGAKKTMKMMGGDAGTKGTGSAG